MDDPHDDTDVPSGTTDGAQMESTSRPVSRRDALDTRVTRDTPVTCVTRDTRIPMGTGKENGAPALCRDTMPYAGMRTKRTTALPLL